MAKKLEEDDVDDEVVGGLVVEGEKQQSLLRRQHRQNSLRRHIKVSSKLEETWFKFLVIRSLIFIVVLGSTWYCCCNPSTTATTTQEDEMKIKHEWNRYFTPQLTEELRSYWETLKLDNNVNSYQNNQTIVRRSLQQQSPLPSQQGDNFTPTRTCGQLISVTSLENAKQIAEMFLTVILPPDILSNNPSIVELAKSIVFGILQYGVATYKVCMSCQDVMTMALENSLNLNSDDPLYGFQSYCSSSSPAYDVVSTAGSVGDGFLFSTILLLLSTTKQNFLPVFASFSIHSIYSNIRH